MPDLTLVLLRAWDLIGKKAENGYLYVYCQHSRRITKFVEHFDKICTDTASINTRNMSLEAVVSKITSLIKLDPEYVDQFFMPELEQELAADVEPEIKLEDMPDPKNITVKSYVGDTKNIPFSWIVQKLIPYLTETRRELPPGKLECLLGYWRLWRQYEERYPKNIEEDYVEMRDCKSNQFEDRDVRAKLLAIAEAMFKKHRRWRQTKAGDRPTRPTLRNVFNEVAVKTLLQQGGAQNKQHAS